ncbi:MAG: DUF58 domain-containing protein [Pseudolysinimonas sp.]|uniref:DUF58 domain-containing protein n=1 Tax=Pseudolysinimonas sp. TaxID=2680009 RepID=UPI003267DDCA
MSTETRSRSRSTHATRTSSRTRTGTVTRYTLTRTGLAVGVNRGRRLLRRTRAAAVTATDWLRTTVTPAGWLLVAVAIAGVVGGLTFGLVEGWVVAMIAVVMLVLSVPFLLGAHDYGVHLELTKDRVVAGSEVIGSLDIVNRSSRVALPGVVDIPVGLGLVEVHVPLLRGGAGHRERLSISAPRRGVIQVGPMTIGRGDPVGILRREHAWPGSQQIFVHPVTVAIPSTSAGLVRDLEGAPTSDIVDSDLSFHAIRQYVSGDSYRHVHWKSTAKTGQLMVRQYEETRHSRIAIVLDLETTAYTDDDEFEMSVSAAASLGVQGVRDGRDVLVAASADIPDYSRDVVRSIQTLSTFSTKNLLDGFAGVENSDNAMPLELVSRLTVQSFPELSIAFLVTGSQVDLTRLRAAAFAFPPQVAVVAVRSEPGAEPTLRSAKELSVLTIGTLNDLKNMMARGAVR